VEEDKYFIYRHIRLDKNVPFYIGIGTKGKRDNSYRNLYARAFISTRRGVFWNRIVAKTKYRVEIIFETSDNNFLDIKEREFIKLYGRRNIKTGSLVNLTDGGRGILGLKHSPSTISKIALTKKQFIENYKDAVYDLYNKDLKIIEISKQLGINRITVRKIIKTFNFAKRENVRSQKFFFYQHGVFIMHDSLKNIAECLNLSYGGVLHIMQRGTSKKYKITKYANN